MLSFIHLFRDRREKMTKSDPLPNKMATANNEVPPQVSNFKSYNNWVSKILDLDPEKYLHYLCLYQEKTLTQLLNEMTKTYIIRMM